MKKIIMTAALAIAAIGAVNAQTSDVQHATLNTQMNTLMALRPYDGITAEDNQSLSTTVTNASDVLAAGGNQFHYTGASSYQGLAYKIFSNVTYQVSLQAASTGGSNDELNNYINFHAESLPSPQNGLPPYVTNNNLDHLIDVASDTRLAYATGTPVRILHNATNNTGKYLIPSAPYSPLDPASTDWAAFGIKFVCSPGFAVFPGTFATNLTITATPL
jgi:hypothetical protein